MLKSKLIVLSDIHISTNAPTVWYQKELHEPYLTTVLDYVIKQASSIRELILLGDVVDFWTYPPDERSPSFADIIAANPNILGLNGKLSEVLTVLEGKITYVRGNHDINITQEDLNQIQNPKGYTIKLSPDDIYYPLGNDNKKIACTHGHLFTMFNAPDISTKFKPLPIGHFVTRAVAYQQKHTLAPGQTVADVPDQGAPNGINLSDLINSVSPSITETLLDYITSITHLSQEQPIILPDGQTTTVAEAKKIYSTLWEQWATQYGGGQDGQLVATKSAIADFNGLYMGWFAQKLGIESGADIVVMGHTHTPKLGLKDSLIQYANSGFECPSKPDITQKHPTFVEIDIDKCQANIFQVINKDNFYHIEPYSAEPESVVAPWSLDYSCYVIIDNTNGKFELQRINYSIEEGHYIVPPLQRIKPGEQARFWIQDYPGDEGSKGTVTYSQNDRNISLSFACPVGFWNPNYCSGANFYTKTGGEDWGKINQVKKLGHPFFVKFVL